MEKLLKNIT